MAKLCPVFFCKQKTAYEMRISDWSSDVCSSDLDLGPTVLRRLRVDDAEAVYRRYAGDPEVTRFLSFRTHDGVEDAAGFCTLMQVEWERSEERGVGKECVSRCRTRGAQNHISYKYVIS